MIEAISRTLFEKFIAWPDETEYDEISAEFSDIKATPFPGIKGAIDGTHIRIDPPKDSTEKKIHSIIFQGVCIYKYQYWLAWTSP